MPIQSQSLPNVELPHIDRARTTGYVNLDVQLHSGLEMGVREELTRGLAENLRAGMDRLIADNPHLGRYIGYEIYSDGGLVHASYPDTRGGEQRARQVSRGET